VNYYTNIGASIDSEDYFELMIRNAWHVGGGQGAAAESATRRVLVTRADGSQYVEQVPNDQPQYEEKVQKIQPHYTAWSKPVYESVHTQTFSLFHGDGVPTLVKTQEPAGQPKTLRDVASSDSFNSREYLPSGQPVRPSTAPTADGSRGDPEAAMIAQVGPKTHPLDLPSRPSTAQPYIPYAPRRADAKPPVKDPSPGVQYIIVKLKAEMKRRGALGFIGIQRKFRIMDDDNDRSLSLAEFKKAMKEMQVPLEDSELRLLFEHFDTDRSGGIDFEEFVQGVRDPLSDRRRALVELAFATLDKDGNGVIDGTEVASVYDASHHPDVISGKRTPKQVLQEFLETFDVGGEVDGKVTLQEFINYYTNIGANIDNEDYFELMIRNAWHISGGEGAAAESAARRVLVTKADGSQVVELAQKPAYRNPEDLNMSSGLSAHTNRRFYKQSNSTSDAAMAVLNPAAVAGSVVPKKKANATASSRVPTAAVGVLIDRLKSEMAKRGASGFIGLQRKFRIVDDDNSKNIDLGEFKKAMKEMNITLTDTEFRLVFNHFDIDNSGTIDFEEFIQGVRDPLSERRLDLVTQAFGKIDKDGNGIVDATEIASMYDASKHPEVIAGRKTAQQVGHVA
jgi:Ca2+-binding EF-hand superfamily protein